MHRLLPDHDTDVRTNELDARPDTARNDQGVPPLRAFGVPTRGEQKRPAPSPEKPTRRR
jgi:hypothetical protein